MSSFTACKVFVTWQRKLGPLQVDVVEDESTGKRTIRTTSICWGNKLSLLVSMPFHDPRIPPNPNDPDLDFSQAQTELNTEADWQKVSLQYHDLCHHTCTSLLMDTHKARRTELAQDTTNCMSTLIPAKSDLNVSKDVQADHANRTARSAKDTCKLCAQQQQSDITLLCLSSA